MIAAVLARKSTDHEAGVSRQVELAEDFIRARGWTLDPAHIYADNNVSGGTFDRPGLNALLAAVSATPCPFGVLVMMDASRLGREQSETLSLQVRITKAGVRIFHYQDNVELKVGTATEKLMAQIPNFGHEHFKEQITLKTRDALNKKAAQGHAVGGTIYGYVNHEITDATGKRDHVEFRINDREAEVVRRIFTMAAEGQGIRAIATRLNQDEIPAPRSRHVCGPACKHKKTFHGSWMATTITTLLNRELYRGRRRYGRDVDMEMPELRIVDEDLWRRAQQRRAKTRAQHHGYRKPNGQLAGRSETPSPHLLSGLLECGACGSSMVATSRVNKDKSVRRYYACAKSYKQSASGCRHLLNYAGITDAVLGHFAHLTPFLIEQMVADELDRCLESVKALTGQKGALIEERARLDRELARLAEAVAQGGQIPALLAALEAKQAARDTAAAKIEHTEGSAESIRGALAEWQARMLSITTATLGGLGAALQAGKDGRRLLRLMIEEPVVVTPEYGALGEFTGWSYSGNAHLGRLSGQVSSTCQRDTNFVRIS